MTPIAIATILIIIINIPAELTAHRRHARKYVNRFSISVQYDRPFLVSGSSACWYYFHG